MKLLIGLIENMIPCFENVDPDRVTSWVTPPAVGWRLSNFAPRMADRWAAAAMMAGHPERDVGVGFA